MRLPKLAALLSALLLVVTSVTGCASEEPNDEDADAADEAAALSSPPLMDHDMLRVKQPGGMPAAWEQPDSTGVFDEKGKCGPTAVANTLRLYGVEVSPQQAYDAGVHWIIGTRGQDIVGYMSREHANLGCTLEHPENGGRFLRDSLAAGHPVMIWFMSGERFQSHWVVAVGRHMYNNVEHVVVMSWGNYYLVPMNKLLASWHSVYGIRNPAVVCDATTNKIVH